MSNPLTLVRTRSLPLLIQSEAAECGLACLGMIASAYGYHLDLNEIRHRFHVSLKGTTLKDLVTFAKRLGLASRALRLEPPALAKLRCPAILHMDMNHFVVLKEVRGRDAIVHDPALGIRRLSAEQLNRRFTGIALELTPTDAFVRKSPASPLRLAALVGRLPLDQGFLPKALLLSISFQLLALAAPVYVQLTIDRAVTYGDADALLSLAIGFALLALLRSAVAWVRARVLLAFAGLMNTQLVATLVRRMLRLPNAWFESRHVSALLSRISSTQPIRELIAEGLVAAVVDGVMAVLTIMIALLFAPLLALIVLAGFGSNAALKWWQVRRSMEREHQYVEAFAKAQQEIIETVRGIATVKLFRKEHDRERRWTDRHVESVNARFWLDAVRAKADLGRDLIQALVLGAVVYFGARQVIAGEITLGLLMAFITYQQMFTDASAKLLEFGGRFRLLDVHLQRLGDIMHSEPESDEALTADSEKKLEGSIRAESLSFRYGDLEDPIFTGVSFSIDPGEFIAITGPSGGGKTTLLKLLVGLLEPSSGSVLYDGVQMHKLGLGTLRDQIGVVMQDDVMLSGSIAQNITFFDSTPDTQWMKECARIAAIDDDIAQFPMGYNTLVGDMGTVLSGGQRQRVLLARALYKSPRILFMDEGTSSLDTDKEREVNKNLQALSITRVIIAHRKDTIDSAQRVFELSATGLNALPQRG